MATKKASKKTKTKSGKPRKGVIPPQLKAYLFSKKKGSAKKKK